MLQRHRSISLKLPPFYNGLVTFSQFTISNIFGGFTQLFITCLPLTLENLSSCMDWIEKWYTQMMILFFPHSCRFPNRFILYSPVDADCETSLSLFDQFLLFSGGFEINTVVLALTAIRHSFSHIVLSFIIKILHIHASFQRCSFYTHPPRIKTCI